jgi:uncharacterized membrane protein
MVSNKALRIPLAALGVTLGLMASSTVAMANTNLIFCNKTGSKVQVAVAWVDVRTNKWMMGSWYTRNPGECKSHGTVKTGLFYYYAEKVGQNFYWPAKANVDKTYCVPNRGVREMANSSCGQGERRLGFQGRVAGAGKYTMNFN